MYHHPGYTTPWPSRYELAVDELSKVGIKVELKPQEYGEYISTTFLGKFEKLAMGPVTPSWRWMIICTASSIPASRTTAAMSMMPSSILCSSPSDGSWTSRSVSALSTISSATWPTRRTMCTSLGLSYHVHQPHLKGFAPKIGHTMVHRVIAHGWINNPGASTMREYLLKRVLLIVPTLFLVSILVFMLMHMRSGTWSSRCSRAMPTPRRSRRCGASWGSTSRCTSNISPGWVACCRRPGAFAVDQGAHPGGVRQALPRDPRADAADDHHLGHLRPRGGVLSAIRQETWVDYLGRVVAILALAMPVFWLAILVVVIPSIYWRWTPLWTYVPLSTDVLENLKIMIFPAAVFGVSRAGPIMRITRSAMLEVQRQDYIRTAWAKGLPGRSVILKHAIKNALIPVVSIIGLQIHFYLGGSVIIETIFRLPGIGSFFVEALIRRDFRWCRASI